MINKLKKADTMVNKYQLSFILVIVSMITMMAQSPVSDYEWSTSDENSYRSVVIGINPFGDQANLLEITPDGNWRGYEFQNIAINPSVTYRFSFWMRASSISPSYTFAGKITTLNGLTRSDGTTTNDSYIQSGWSVPGPNNWYLYVGFVKGNSDTSNYSNGVYTQSTVIRNSASDFSFTNGLSSLSFGASGNSTDPTNKIYFYDFRVEAVTSDSVHDLLNPLNSNPPSTGNPDKLDLTGLTAEQSSTYSSASPASKAIDGNTSGDGQVTVTHTLESTNNWWRIDLGAEYDLSRIDIYNRTNCCSDRLAGTKVYVGSVDSYTPTDYQQVGTTLTDSPLMQQLNFSATGRYIMVSQHDKGSSILSLAEVEAYGTLSTTGGNDSGSGTTDNGGGGTSGGSSLWTSNGNNINFSSGKVGIGTNTIGDYELFAVKGNIRAQEIKVETANWPDYVFTKNYKLPTLKEVENHINQKGHLMNIPSAKEAEVNGVKLGEMNRLLLEKLEELTLYIIQLKNENDLQQEQINQLITKK